MCENCPSPKIVPHRRLNPDTRRPCLFAFRTPCARSPLAQCGCKPAFRQLANRYGPAARRSEPVPTRGHRLGILLSMPEPGGRPAWFEAKRPHRETTAFARQPQFRKRRPHPSDTIDTASPAFRSVSTIRVGCHLGCTWSYEDQSDQVTRRQARRIFWRTAAGSWELSQVSAAGASEMRAGLRDRLTRPREARVLRHEGRDGRGAQSPAAFSRSGIPCPSVDASGRGRPRAFPRQCCGSEPGGHA